MDDTPKLQPSNGNDQLSGKQQNTLLGKREHELVKARCTSRDGFDPSSPLSNGSGSSTKLISGIQNSPIYFTSTSSSDRLSWGSQEKKGSKRMKLSHEGDSVGHLSTELKSIPTRMEERQPTSDRLVLDNDTPNTKCSQIDGKLDTSWGGSSPTILLDAMHDGNRRDELISTTEINHDTEVSLEKMPEEEILALLELDDPADEERFRMAMEMPLSPTLPEIEIPDMEAYKLNDSIIIEEGTNKIGSDALSSDKDVAFHVKTGISNVEIQVSTSSTKMEVANKENKEVTMEFPSTHGEGHECENNFKYFVAFPTIKDEIRISRIVSACETCMSNSSTVSKTDWMVEKVLVALANEKSLLPEENACVFFSALLHFFLVVTTLNSRNFLAVDINSYSDSFLKHMKIVMSDVGLSKILLGLFQLETLLTLIEGFLIHKRVMIYRDASQQPRYDSQNIKIQDGTSIMISSEMATTDKLIAGSSILACICATTGHIGFVCDVSYKFLQMHRSDDYLTLTVLHVFASVCGSKYFNLSSHSFIMSIVMAVVTLLEGENTAAKATHGLLVRCGSESRPKFGPCPQCVFSRGAASVEQVLDALLKKLQDFAFTVIEHEPNVDIIDVFSLVELLGYYIKTWDWIWSKVIPQLLNMVESCVSEKVSAAVILLIGQLGRFKINDGGYEQQEVEELRCGLCVFLKPKTRNWSLHTQFAIVHTLIGLRAVDFTDLTKEDNTSKCNHANLVRSWFSQLTEEQKKMSLEILQSA